MLDFRGFVCGVVGRSTFRGSVAGGLFLVQLHAAVKSQGHEPSRRNPPAHLDGLQQKMGFYILLPNSTRIVRSMYVLS